MRVICRDCKNLGFSGEDLASIALDTVGLASADGEEYAPAYLAVADLLWKDGMLPGKVQATVLSLIETAKLSERFEDAPSRRKHQAALQALVDQLRSAQPNSDEVSDPKG